MTAYAEIRVVSYNVENCFYPERDSLNPDSAFTPEGEKRWSYKRYYHKVENIARVLTNIGEWDGVDIIGLQEVENKECVKRLCYTLRADTYDFVHYDSPDKRGIDVALIYKKNRVDTLRTRAIPVDLGTETTRDILYVCALIDRTDTMHCLVCHMPSQRGKASASAWKRAKAKEVLQHVVDSILHQHPKAHIVVMGDMNSEPQEDLKGLRNKMLNGGFRADQGTHKHQGRWACLDQFYISPSLDSISTVRIYDAEWIQETDERFLGLKPKRTYNGFTYQKGYSDHLPVILDIKR